MCVYTFLSPMFSALRHVIFETDTCNLEIFFESQGPSPQFLQPSPAPAMETLWKSLFPLRDHIHIHTHSA